MHTGQEPAQPPTTTGSRHAVGWLLLFLANLGVGVWLLQRSGPPQPPPIWAFILFFIAAVILLIAGTDRVKNPVPLTPSPHVAGSAGNETLISIIKRVPLWRWLLLLIALLSTVMLLAMLARLDRLADHRLPALLWLVAIAAYALAVSSPGRHAWRTLSPRKLRATKPERRAPLIILLAIVTAALLLRVTFLEAIPYTLAGDEASQGLEAVRVLQGEIRNPFTTGWLGVPTLSFFFNSLTVELLGMTKTALRLPWALLGSATVLAAFLLVRQLHGAPLALATAALLAFYHYHIHFSRLGSNQIADPFFVTASLYLLYRALQQRKRVAWVATGACVGLAFYFYAGARFTPVVVLALLFFIVAREPASALQAHLRGILAMAGSFLIVAAPMLQYAVRFPDDFNARLNQVGIIQSGWLERELANGQPLLSTLWDQFRRAALAFNYYPDRTVWYGLEAPLLDPLFGALFAVGLLYGTLLFLWRRDRRVLPFVLWWWGGMLAGGMLTESPPSSQRLTTLTVPVCFFIASVLWQLAGLLRDAIPALSRRAFSRRALLALGVAAFALSSVHLYFFDFTPQYRYGGKHAELATTLAPILNQTDQTHDAYFVGAPWMYWGFATIPYLSPQMHGDDLLEPLTAPPAYGLLRPQRGAIFIVRPERAEELPLIQERFPQGQLHEIHSRAPNRELLATLYIIAPDSTP